MREGDQLSYSSNNGVRFRVEGAGLIADWQTETAPSTFEVRVKCFDYGAHGFLKAEYDYAGVAASNSDRISIPEDDNNNQIADNWERAHNMYKSDDAEALAWAESDLEGGPTGNSNHGDGYSIFEEYRGFMVKGNHQRTDPSTTISWQVVV